MRCFNGQITFVTDMCDLQAWIHTLHTNTLIRSAACVTISRWDLYINVQGECFYLIYTNKTNCKIISISHGDVRVYVKAINRYIVTWQAELVFKFDEETISSPNCMVQSAGMWPDFMVRSALSCGTVSSEKFTHIIHT